MGVYSFLVLTTIFKHILNSLWYGMDKCMKSYAEMYDIVRRNRMQKIGNAERTIKLSSVLFLSP